MCLKKNDTCLVHMVNSIQWKVMSIKLISGSFHMRRWLLSEINNDRNSDTITKLQQRINSNKTANMK